MGKINLKINAERVFGKYLPSVFIETIEVDYPSNSTGGYLTDRVKIIPKLSINFTIPATEVSESDVEEWFKNVFNDLYLYTWISPHSIINNKLDAKRLNLKDLFNSLQPVSRSTFDITHPTYDTVMRAMKDGFKNKFIDYFGLGGGTEGGWSSVPPSVFPENTEHLAPWGGNIATLYYFCNSEQLLGSIDTPGSIFNNLFYGDHGVDVNIDGPWDGMEPDLPSTFKYHKTGVSDGITASTILNSFTDPYFGDFTGTAGASPIEEGMTGIPLPGFLFDEDHDGQWQLDIVPDGLSYIRRNLDEYLSLYTQDESSIAANTYQKIRLSDLVGEEGFGELVKRKIYDSKGNEIFQVANIKLEFEYNGDHTSLVNISSIEKLFLISCVGLDVDGTSDVGYDGLMNQPDGIFNNYFGGISYENILKYGKYDDSYNEIFVLSENDTPYDGLPIQALNGKYYAEEPVSRDVIFGSMNKLIADYKNQYTKDMDLQQHIKNLQYVLVTYKESVGLFAELKRFQKTFTHKSQATASGRFYAEVVDGLTQFSKKVMVQKEVRKKLIMNTTVMDLRPAKFLSAEETYRPYDPDITYETGLMDDGGVKHTGDVPLQAAIVSDDYIPRKWMVASRRTKPTSVSPAEGASDESAARMSEWDEIYNDYLGESTGDGPSDLQKYTSAELFTENEFYNDPRADLLDKNTGFERNKYANLLCENSGYFFFDWEKALRTQSNISKVVKLSKLHRFLGLTCPYEYFKVKTVRMIRNELEYESQDAEGNDSTVKMYYAQNKMTMSDAAYPKSMANEYSVYSNSDEDGNPTDLEESFQYGIPEALILDDDENYRLQSCVKFVNFDVAASNYNKRLEGWGEFSPYGLDRALEIGQGIRDGYRLMCFRYRDFMDDDIAFYNTKDITAFDERNLKIAAENNREEPYSQYVIEVTVEDLTLKFYTEQLYMLLYNAYTDLVGYYEYAAELCSYNNITNQFNEFFVDAVNEKYLNAEDKPWIKASYIITACRQIFFSSFEALGSETEQNIITAALELVNRMGPERGTLDNLRTFTKEYKRFLCYMNPNLATPDSDGEITVSDPPAPLIFNRVLELLGETDISFYDISSVTESAVKMHTFVNSVSIDQHIYGDLTLSAYDADDRLPAIGPGGAYPKWQGNPMIPGPYDGYRRLGQTAGDAIAEGIGAGDSGGYEEMRSAYYGEDAAFFGIDAAISAPQKEFGFGHIATAMLLPSARSAAFSMLLNYNAYDYGGHELAGGDTIRLRSFVGTDSAAGRIRQETVGSSMGMAGELSAEIFDERYDYTPSRDLGGTVQSATAKMAYLIELMMWIASGIYTRKGYTGYLGDPDGGYHDPAADTSAMSYSKWARKTGENVPGLSAGALLYVIRNDIYPKVWQVDDIMNGSDTTETISLDPTSGDAGPLSMHPDMGLFVEDPTGWSAFDVVMGAALGYKDMSSFVDSWETTDARRLFADAAFADGVFIEPFARWHLFRAALKHLHNGLLNIVFDKIGHDESYGTGYGRDASDLTEIPEESYVIAAHIRTYLDPFNPVGPDYCNLTRDGERDFSSDSFHMDDDVWDDYRDSVASYTIPVSDTFGLMDHGFDAFTSNEVHWTDADSFL